MGKRYSRPRTTYDMVERVESLARELADDDTQISGFHDALTVVVKHVENE